MKDRLRRLKFHEWFMVVGWGVYWAWFAQAPLQPFSWARAIIYGGAVSLAWFAVFQLTWRYSKLPRITLVTRFPSKDSTESLKWDQLFRQRSDGRNNIDYHGFEGGETWTFYKFSGGNMDQLQSLVKEALGDRIAEHESFFTVRKEWSTDTEEKVAFQM